MFKKIIVNGAQVLANVTRKVFFHAVTIAQNNPETVIRFFNTSAGVSGSTDFDTNWPSNTNSLPSNIQYGIDRIGFAIRTKSGTAILPATLMILSSAVLTVKIGDREVKNGTLSEFFKMPVTVASGAVSDIKAGPSWVKLGFSEPINPKEDLKFELKIPASIGQEVQFVSMIDGPHAVVTA